MTATNSVEPAKDGNAAAFNLTFAAESVSGNKAQKTYLGEPVGETIITPAQDGTDGTGITAPTGAIGIRGWLSGIYSKLAGAIAVNVSSLPALTAGTAAIGSIIGRTTMVTATPVVTSNGVYVGGNEIGGLMTFPVGGAGTGGTFMSITITSKSVLASGLIAFVFTANPSSSTWTDKITPAINTADIAKLLCAVPLNIYYTGLGTMTEWDAGDLGAQFSAANLYVVLIADGSITLTSTSTSDFTVQLGMKVD